MVEGEVVVGGVGVEEGGVGVEDRHLDVAVVEHFF
jgi:hypothetical protein